MKKLSLTLASVFCMTMAALANAGTITMAGAAGVRDSHNIDCSDPDELTNSMEAVFGGSQCLISYPLALPVGTVIDSIQIAYYVPTLNMGPPSLVAMLGQNRINPNLGVIAIGGNSVSPNVTGQGFLSLSNLNVTVAAGSSYWVQLFDTNAVGVNAVTVTYH